MTERKASTVNDKSKPATKRPVQLDVDIIADLEADASQAEVVRGGGKTVSGIVAEAAAKGHTLAC